MSFLSFFDYEILRIVWWVLLGVLLIGFTIFDGFDFGSAILSPFVAKTDSQRRVILNAIGPVWDGNQVWFILGGGAMFAAWPHLYAVAFSVLYIPLMIVLMGFILRPVAIDFRSKMNGRWRSFWDWTFFVSGIVPSILFGVAFGNAMSGLSFSFDEFLAIETTTSFFDLLTPFTLTCGALSLAMIANHGANYLCLKTEGGVEERSRKAAIFIPIVMIVLFSIGGFLVSNVNGQYINIYFNKSLPSMSFAASVISKKGAWLNNYFTNPFLVLAPVLGYSGMILSSIFAFFRKYAFSFAASCVSIVGIISTAGLSMFPFFLTSKTDPSASLMIWNSSSSKFTLTCLSVVVAIFLPIVFSYIAYTYYVVRGKIKEENVVENKNLY